MDTFAIAATRVATSSSSAALGQGVFPSYEPPAGRLPLWARLAVMVGASAALWALIGWTAMFLVLKLR